LGTVVATAEQVKGMMTVIVEQKILVGMRVRAIRGSYKGFFGIVREINDSEATVDYGIYGKMVAVRIAIDDLEQS